MSELSDRTWLPLQIVAERLAVCPRTVGRMIESGQLYAINIGAKPSRAHWRVSAESLAEFEASRASQPVVN